MFFIVNDDVDIAVLVKADGVHIGQDDLPIEKDLIFKFLKAILKPSTVNRVLCSRNPVIKELA